MRNNWDENDPSPKLWNGRRCVAGGKSRSGKGARGLSQDVSRRTRTLRLAGGNGTYGIPATQGGVAERAGATVEHAVRMIVLRGSRMSGRRMSLPREIVHSDYGSSTAQHRGSKTRRLTTISVAESRKVIQKIMVGLTWGVFHFDLAGARGPGLTQTEAKHTSAA